MPLNPGEVSLLTLFADVHTYFAPPTTRPPHHRFDRRSYLYLFHDVMNKRGRVELANNAGTPDQDAFNGYLDMAKVEYSYKQPTLFTITVDGQGHGSPLNDISQWHLPAHDPRNENKYMYKIHTLDIYLWTADDASLFLDSLKRVLQPAQLILSHVPANLHSEHRNSMSPVVQQLENAAISVQPQRNTSVSTTQSFPPPPPQPVNGAQSHTSPEAQQNYAPISAYNPAAPAAPEQRTHREKTPPPPDADGGTGLTAAAHQEMPNQFAGPPQGGYAPQHTPYMPGPPSMAPPPQQSLHRTSTMGSIGAIPPPPHSASPYQQSFAPPPLQASSPPQDPNAHLYAQQPSTPGMQRQSGYPYQPGQPAATQYASYPSATSGPGGPASPGLPQQTPSYAPLQSPGFAPQQGYGQQSSAYSYNPNATQHSMHSQVYVPEGSGTPAQAGPGQQQGNGKLDPSKLDQRMDRIEKGVGKFLKRLDKKM